MSGEAIGRETLVNEAHESASVSFWRKQIYSLINGVKSYVAREISRWRKLSSGMYCVILSVNGNHRRRENVAA